MNTQRGSRLIKNSINSIFNKFFSLLTTWFISIWVARQLGPSNYGVFSLVLWLSSTFTWLIGMGLILATTKFIAEYKEKGENATCSAIVFFILKIEISISFLVTIILIIFNTEIADYFFSPKESFYFFLAFLGLIPGILTAIFSASIEGLQKFEYFTIAALTLSPLSVVCKIAVLWFGFGISGLLLVMLVFSFLNTAFYLFVLKKEKILSFPNIHNFGKDIKRRILKYNTSVLAIQICDKIVWDKSENFFLGRFCKANEIAFYNLGFNLAQKIISILPSTFWSVLFPAMSGYFGSGDRAKMTRVFFISTRYLAFFTFPVCIGGIILAYHIIRYLYGPDYIGAQRVLQILFFSLLFSSLANPGSAILYGYEKQAFIYKFGSLLAALNIILNILIIPKYGAIGAATCYAIVTIVASVGGLWYTCKTMKLRYPLVSIFKIAFSTIIMGIVMEIIILRNSSHIGFIASLFCGVFVYLICSLVLGTFQEEDYRLLQAIKEALPGKSAKWMNVLIEFISQFKNSSL